MDNSAKKQAPAPTRAVRAGLNDLRRRLRAPYQVRAVLEIAGVTPRGGGIDVITIDANEWGVRVSCRDGLPVGSVGRLHLQGPRAHPLDVDATILWSRQLADGAWEVGMDFMTRQPLLSASEIDVAAFAS